MLKLLIVCKKLETAKSIINQISANIRELRLIGISNTTAESIKIIKRNKPDLIITTNTSIITLVKEKFISYYPEIILFSKTTNIDEEYENLLIEDAHKSIEEVSNQIVAFVQERVNSEREKSTKILLDLGFNFKMSGTVYLLDSILYVRTYKGSYSFEKLEKDIYSYVAEINNTTIERVKWSVARTINNMYKNHTKESYKFVEKYLGLVYPQKPTPKFLISIIANNLDR